MNRYDFSDGKSREKNLTRRFVSGQIWQNKATGLRAVLLEPQGKGKWSAYTMTNFSNRMDFMVMTSTLAKDYHRIE